MGPLLFSLALHPLLERIKGISGIDIVVGYLDDIVLAGEAASISEALQLIVASGLTLGLEVNLRKCELIPTATTNTSVDLGSFPAEVKRVHDGNFKLLGAPIGSRDHCATFTKQKRVDKAKTVLDKAIPIEDQQIAHKLFVQCLGSCRLMHAMRTTRPDWIQAEAAQADSNLLDAWEASSGTALTPEARSQAALPIRLGGLGLRSVRRHCSAACLSSRFNTRGLMRSH